MNEANTDRVFRAIIENEIGGSFPALMEFDERRGTLYDQLAAAAVDMTESRATRGMIGLDIENVNQSVDKLFAEILASDAEADERLGMITDIIKADSDERLTLMRSLLGLETDGSFMTYYPREELADMVNTIVLTGSDSSNDSYNLMEFYKYDMNYDVRNFLEHLTAQHKERLVAAEGAEAPYQIKKSIGEHAVDVAKIAAGASIALAINHFLRRK